MALGVSSLVTRLVRLLLTWMCLVSPWLALVSTEALLVETSNVPAEERESITGEEEDEVALSGARRLLSRRYALRPPQPQTVKHEWPRKASLPRKIAAPPQASSPPHRAPAKILLRRTLPQGEDPFSRNA